MSQTTSLMVSRGYRTIAVMTVVTSVIWTALSVYSVLSKPPAIDVNPTLLEPLTPTLDRETLESLQNRRQISTETRSDDVVRQAIEILVVEPTVAPSPTPEPTPESTPIENVEETPLSLIESEGLEVTPTLEESVATTVSGSSL